MTHKKRIGIMTWYKYINYGSILQAYALACEIEQLKYEPFFIDYIPKKNRFKDSDYTYMALIKKIIRYISGFSVYKNTKKNMLFESFVHKYFNQTQSCTSIVELKSINNKFDAFVCGSDQIWAPNCFDEKYFLSFVEQSEKMIAYAPSIGVENINNADVLIKMGELISRFTHLSVRETQGKNIIEKNWNLKAEVVLDPTLLLSGEQWNQYLKISKGEGGLQEKEYIICYFLGNPVRYQKYMREIKKKINLPIYIIPTFRNQSKAKNRVPFEVGPKEFIQLIQNASYVCTDSFHGMAFSINYNIPFFVFERFKKNDRENQNTRIYSLLQILELEKYLINCTCMVEEISEHDFQEVNIILERERKKSKQYLKIALMDSTKPIIKDLNKKSRKEITKYCCGCGCCTLVCPRNAIKIAENEHGFLEYFIIEEKCIDCGKCIQVCPFVDVASTPIKEAKSLYAMKSKDKKILKTSSSGGIAYEIAKYKSERDYNICGCYYNSIMKRAEHIFIKAGNIYDLTKIQGSKYIQSNMVQAINEIVKCEKKSKNVFFGTPCQVAGMDKVLRYLGCRENVLLVDLICHGVPTQKLWDKYLDEIISIYKIKEPPQVVFREKEKGWRTLTIGIFSGRKRILKEQYKDVFYTFFRLGQCYMPSCYECPYRVKASADIRLGDYWGQRFLKEKEGMSMVVAVSQTGNELIEEFRKEAKILINKYSINEYFYVQYPDNSMCPPYYESILGDIKNKKYQLQDIKNKYCKYLLRRDKISKIREKFIGLVK